MSEILIEGRNLTKEFTAGRKKKVRAVTDVSLQILQGETLGLVGESGCGKSTLGRLLIRLLKPDSGRLLVHGEDVTDLSDKEFGKYRRQLQLIFQDPYASLDPRLCVRDLIAEPLKTWHVCRTKEELTQRVLEKMEEVKKSLEALGKSVKIDDRDTLRPGFKFAEWELKGVPVRLAMGPRDLAAGTVEVHRRDTLEKETMSLDGLDAHICKLLDDIQANIYRKAYDFRQANVEKCDNWEEFKEKIQNGKFLLCHWDGTAETEQKIKDETKATIRCIPEDSFVCEEEGVDIYSGKPSKQRVVFAISY